MIKNYFKIAIRNRGKQSGLAFNLFMLYAVNEFSFDNFHKNGDHVFHVYKWAEPAGDNPFEAIPYQPLFGLATYDYEPGRSFRSE